MSSAVFLTFQPAKGRSAEEAMRCYADLFDDAEIVSVTRHPDDSPGAGTVQIADLVIQGLHVRLSDSFIEHEWDFTPATSLWIECASAAEQRRLVHALSEGGRVHMPLDDYGFGPFAWVDDRYGVSWQLARADDPDRIELSIPIAASSVAVWELISEPGWYIGSGDLTEHDVSWDGPIATVIDPECGRVRLRREVSEPPHRIVDRGMDDDASAAGRTVEFRLADSGDGVTVEITESGFAAMPVPVPEQRDQREQNRRVWRQKLDLAKNRLEG